MASPSSCPRLLVAAGLPPSFPRLPSPPPPPLPVVEGEDGEATKNGVLLDPENPDLSSAVAAEVLAFDDTDHDDDNVNGAASSRKKQKPLSSFTSLPSLSLSGTGPLAPVFLYRSIPSCWAEQRPFVRSCQRPSVQPCQRPSVRQLPFSPDRPNGGG